MPRSKGIKAISEATASLSVSMLRFASPTYQGQRSYTKIPDGCQWYTKCSECPLSKCVYDGESEDENPTSEVINRIILDIIDAYHERDAFRLKKLATPLRQAYRSNVLWGASPKGRIAALIYDRMMNEVAHVWREN